MQRAKILLFLIVVAASPAFAATPAEAGAASEIRQTMAQQVEAWNRGDIDGFMQAYKDAPDTTFIGKSVEQGYAPILARYKRVYGTKDAMGTLEFSDLEVRSLNPGYAIATGRFHLTRTAAAGGDARGIFSLVLEHTSSGWRIILDHTSAAS